MGLWHEQSRKDRDQFITINWASIDPATKHNFDQHIQDESFFFTNMSPQVGLGFNRGAWRMLEEHVRDGYLSGLPDGLRSFAIIVRAVRGVVPR